MNETYLSPAPSFVNEMLQYEANSLVELANTLASKWSVFASKQIIRNASAALALLPNLATAYLIRAKGHFWLGEWEAAVTDFKSLEQLDRTFLDSNVLYMIGEALSQCEEMGQAAEYFARSFDSNAAEFSLQTDGAWPWYLLADNDASIKGLEWALVFTCKSAEQTEEAVQYLISKYRQRSADLRQQGNQQGATADEDRVRELEVRVAQSNMQ